MPVHSLDIEDFYDENYSLIGIHTTLDDYKLAYLLNQQLKTNFEKANYNLDFENKKNNASFSIYTYSSDVLGSEWFLISNSFKDDKNIGDMGLLLSSEIKTFLIPEKKGVDFFIKITGGSEKQFIEKTIIKIKKITQVITSYSIDSNTLKSKDFLIF